MASEQPKKAPTGYFLFLADNREAIEKEIGTRKGPDVAKKCGEMWKAASEDVRKPYEEKAAKMKAEYQAALQAFKDEGGVMAKKSKKIKKGMEGAKAKKDPDAPKRPVGGGYGQYLNEHREAIRKTLPTDHKMTDIGKQAGLKWNAMSAEDKKPYEEKYLAKMETFKGEMEAYKEKLAEAAAQEPESPPAKTAGKKRAGDESDKKQPQPRKAKVAKAASKKNTVEINEAVLLEAQKEGLYAALQNLAGRPDVIALGATDEKMLSVLKQHNGLVNAAKHALLGA